MLHLQINGIGKRVNETMIKQELQFVQCIKGTTRQILF